VSHEATETTNARGVVVVEPPLPRRARRPADLARLIVSLLLLALPLVLGNVAAATSTGLEQDIFRSTSGLPKVALLVVTYAAGFAVLALPVALALDLMVRRRPWQLLDALVAATVAATTAYLFRYWVEHVRPGRLLEALTKELETGVRSSPAQGLLAGIVAFLCLAQISGRRVWQVAAFVSVGLVAVVGVLSGRVTALSTTVSLLLGWSVGLAVRYAIGAGSTRPRGSEIADALMAAGQPVVRLERIYEDTVEPRRYLGKQRDGRRLRVAVLDRDTYGSALAYRFWRRVRLRGPATRRSFLTVRSAIDHMALMALYVRQAGVTTPELLAVSEVGPYAALVAFRDLPGTTLAAYEESMRDVNEPDPEPLSDETLEQIWRSLKLLQERKIVHRSLTGEHVLLAGVDSYGDSDGVALLEVNSGEIAASDLALRLDTVQLLTTVAIVVGPERAVRTAVDVLGPNPVIDALPLLQSIALSRSTRALLKDHKGLLHDLRTQIIDVTPADPEVEEIKLERLSVRGVVAVLGGAVAVYFIATQFTKVDFTKLASVDWRWASLAFVFAFFTYLGAGMTCVGFVISKVSLFRATLTQYAVGFAGLLAPTAVGTVALNVRFLERSGVDPAVAVSSVGLVQLIMFVGHVILIVLFGVLAGTGAESSFAPPQGAVIAVLIVVIVAIIGLTLPPGRRLIQARVRPLLSRVIPRLVAVFQVPSKLATGLGGALLLNIAYIAALFSSVRAFQGSLTFAAVAVVYLAGSVVGAVVPTPGGIGAIEAAMAAGLTAAGLPGSIAVSAVLLYRIATFWVPIPIGWLSLTYLQRKGAL
jgi:glycosyltransferase 2 family protein